MLRRAIRAAAGMMLVIAIVVLVVIARTADNPAALILVPPPGAVSPYVAPPSVMDIVAAEEDEAASAPAAPGRPGTPATPADPRRPAPAPKPVTRQPATTNPAGATTNPTTPVPPPPATSAAKSPPVTSQGPAIVCPDVAGALPAVPAGARAEVSQELRYLDAILAEANRRLRAAQTVPAPNFVQNTIVGPLVNQRIASLDRIAIAIGRYAARPSGLERLARCTVR